MYHLALAQMRGEPTRGTLTSPEGLSPEEQLSAIVELLAEVDGNDQAARLLGLTPGEVAAHREHARQYPCAYFSATGPGDRLLESDMTQLWLRLAIPTGA